MKNLFVLTGAEISKESGIPTFRDSVDGLWHNYNIEEVASVEGWTNNPEKVLQFYNERRKALENVEPNDGHRYLAKLQEYFRVHIFTQNVDNLHEKAGSKIVYHIHGDLTKARSVRNVDCDMSEMIDIGYNEIKYGDRHPDGGQLRPHVVFFGEFICFEQEAKEILEDSDIMLIVGTSLTVYPAAHFPQMRKKGMSLIYVDPVKVLQHLKEPFDHIQMSATEGMKYAFDKLVKLA